MYADQEVVFTKPQTTPAVIREIACDMYAMDDYTLGVELLNLARSARELYQVVEPNDQLADAWALSALVWWMAPEISARLIERSGYEAPLLDSELKPSIRALPLTATPKVIRGKPQEISLRTFMDGVMRQVSPIMAIRRPSGVNPDPLLVLCAEPGAGNPATIALDRLGPPKPMIVNGVKQYGYCARAVIGYAGDRVDVNTASPVWSPSLHNKKKQIDHDVDAAIDLMPAF